ncbi:pentatricopeptide repeat-containing protein At4g35850, mitochondrial isoform X2 [Selaginella moellendorffii]|nr:pentatricopeptide repeat-containing protein At4g35850, mitochondrial isoform X2 [Selaginella moellendorffii]XP_024540516.1 pentatricopeptide repeat-containing protein At4g35850, mitochondrial isoform X2 [Selaginella moellendorffii]|eukprot:XP_024515076.1 pentatricopeptide repeat-containing protein At4g35850, mitochondrial isoform X2 [Selaginella moellendorffii]
MLVDGVQPGPATFHLLLSGCMKGSRLQDTMFFFEQMRTMGIIPDVATYSLVIAACGKCNQLSRAFRVGEEMEASGVQPKLETFVALLSACGVAGDTDKAFEILRRMTTYGITFNEYCYSALIAAYKNRKPIQPDTFDKIYEIVKKSKALASEDLRARAATGEAEISTDLQDEFCSLITGEGQMRRGAFNRRMLVYHSALRAAADLKNLEGLKKICEMMVTDRLFPDAFCVSQLIRGYVAAGDTESALECFNKHINSGRPVNLDLYMVMIQGAMTNYTPAGMTTAKKLLRQLEEKGFYLNPKVGSDMLAFASKEPEGDFTTANLIWDMMMRKSLRPTRLASQAYLDGLQGREIPDDDPRIASVKAALKTSSPFMAELQQQQQQRGRVGFRPGNVPLSMINRRQQPAQRPRV